jgi:hypothetical protein
MAQQRSFLQTDCKGNSTEPLLCLSGNKPPEHHDEHRSISIVNDFDDMCTTIESLKKLTSISFGNRSPLDWLHLSDVEMQCLKCSLCMQSHKTAK